MDKFCRVLKPIKKFKRQLLQNTINSFGWSTNRKLIVFESDDWGSIRMPSREVYETLLKSGDKADKDPFIRYDSLASEEDLSLLFDVLTKYKDERGNYPVITANCAVANPDFRKIEESGYGAYYYEPFTETLKKYPQHKRSFELWQQGMKCHIFFPQLHCREHINVVRWLRHLQIGKSQTARAFSYKMIGTGDSFAPQNKYAYMDAFNYDKDEELNAQNSLIGEAAELFKVIFGYCSKSFVFPCYIWDSQLEKELALRGIEFIQGSSIQLIPKKKEGTLAFGRKMHYIGQVNKHKQIYLIRNCEFEPSFNKNTDWVDNCLWQIATAFKWNKPATISTHRLNYIGYIDKTNRDNNLKLLSSLIFQIIKRWPNVEFITSVELGSIISEEYGFSQFIST